MNKSQIKWDLYVRALRDFVSTNNHSEVPSGFVYEINGHSLKLGAWVGYIRARGRANNLSTEKYEELSSVSTWFWYQRKPGPYGDKNRDISIHEARKSGKSLQSIANEWDLSRQRVHQIVRRLEK
jgi:hypothetical protein